MRYLATVLAAFAVLVVLFPQPTLAQSADIVVDDDGQATAGSAVDCDGTSTTNVYTSLEAAVNASESDAALTSIYVCPTATPYGPDENILITQSLDITGGGASPVPIAAQSQNGQGEAIRIETSSATTGDLVVSITNLEIRHSSDGGNANAGTITVGSEVDDVEIRGVVIDRQGSLAATSSAIAPNGLSMTVADSDITGGPIGSFARTSPPFGTYSITNNTIREAGDEGIWIVNADVITIADNTVVGTPNNGESRDDRIGIAVYRAETSLELRGNDASAITRAPLLLGADIPVLDPATGTPTPLSSVAQMRDLVLDENPDLGPVAFVSASDGTTLRTEPGNASGDRTDVVVLRRTITSPADAGGSSAYDNAAIDVAASGDVIHLTDGATYDESVSNSVPSGGSKDLGLATLPGGTASVQSLTLLDNSALSVPAGEIAITQTLTLGTGTELSGTPVVLAPGASVSDGGLVLGRLRATRTLGTGTSSTFGDIGLSVTVRGSQAPGTVTVTRVDGDPIPLGDQSIRRVYEVAADQSTGLDVDVDIEYDDGQNGDNELVSASVQDETLLGVFQSPDAGATWTEIPSAQGDASTNTFSVTGLTQLPYFTLAEAGGVLPVELVGFDAQVEGSDAVLTWRTTAETANAGFRVQQKQGTAFQQVGFVDGAGTTSETQRYRFRVEDLEIGPHVFRLMQVDADGATTPSSEVRVQIQPDGRVELSNVAPNPVSASSSLSIAVRKSQPVTVRLYDALGRQVRVLHDGALSAGTRHMLPVDASGLASGIYFVRATGNGFQVTRKFSVVR